MRIPIEHAFIRLGHASLAKLLIVIVMKIVKKKYFIHYIVLSQKKFIASYLFKSVGLKVNQVN